MLLKLFTRALLSSLFFIQFTPPALCSSSLENTLDDIEKDILARYRYGNIWDKSKDFITQEAAAKIKCIGAKVALVDGHLGEIWPGLKIGDLVVFEGKRDGEERFYEDYYAYFPPDGEYWEPIPTNTTYAVYKHTKPEAYFEKNYLAQKRGYREAKAHTFHTTIWTLADNSLPVVTGSVIVNKFFKYQNAWQQYSFKWPHELLKIVGGMPAPSYLALLHLEDHCLWDFMKTKDVLFLEDYVVLRKFRHETVEGHPYQIYEKTKERQEGTKEYIHSAVLGLLDPLEGMETIRQRWSYNQLLFFKGEDLKKEQNLLWGNLQKILETSKIVLPQIPFAALLPAGFKESAQEVFSSGNFSYLSAEQLEETAAQFIDLMSSNIYEWPLLGRSTFTGAIACWTLQFLGVEHWQRYIEEGASPSEALEAILENAIGSVKERTEAIKERYNFQTLTANMEDLAARHSIENVKKGYEEFPGTILKLRGESYSSYSREATHDRLPYTDFTAEQVYYRNDYTATASYAQCRFYGYVPWIVLDEKNDAVEMKFKSPLSIYVNGTLSLDVTKDTEGSLTYDNVTMEASDFFSLKTYFSGQLTISRNGSVIEIDIR